MRCRPWPLIAVAIVAAPLAAVAADSQAPPTLTPIAARDVADACPATARYAQALVGGITRRDARAARPLFAACAAEPRLPGYLWKTNAANLALGAVDLSLGVLDRDDAAFRRAVAETADLRSRSLSTDAQVHAWTVIPDYLLPNTHEPATLAYLPLPPSNAQLQRPPFINGFEAENAAYVNVAARTGTAWITAPRVVDGVSTLRSVNPSDLPPAYAPTAGTTNRNVPHESNGPSDRANRR
jgi:hypothetical protein